MEQIEETPELITNPPVAAPGRSKPPRRLDPIRLSPTDAAIIAAGLGWISANHDPWRTKRQLPFARPELRWAPQTFDRGRYSNELMRRLLDTMESVMEIRGNGARLYDLDPFQIAGLILAVRAQRVSHGHTTSPVGNLSQRAKRLIKRLENYRKRIKRTFIRRHGAETYQTKEHEWQALVRWLRLYMLDCRCQRRRRFRSTRFRRATVQTLFEWAKAELIDRRAGTGTAPARRTGNRSLQRCCRRNRPFLPSGKRARPPQRSHDSRPGGSQDLEAWRYGCCSPAQSRASARTL